MKVLVLSSEPPYPPTHGGARLKLYHLLKHLSQFHEMTLMTMLESPEERELLPPLEKFCRKVLAFDRKPLSTRPSLRERLQAPFYKLVYTEEMAAAIQKELNERAYDLVHVDTPHMLVYTPLLRGRRKIIAAHDSMTLSWINSLPLALGWKRKMRARFLLNRVRAFERRFFAEYDGCVMVAERDKQVIQALCPNLFVQLVPNGIDLEYFQPRGANATDADQLVFTGTMDFRPNVDGALWFADAIFPRIVAARSGAKFEIVGRNPMASVLTLGERPGIFVAGFVPDMRPHLARAAVYVCPLRSGSGMKNKVLEAMAMGKAIVTTPEGASGIGIRDSVECFVAADAEQFATATLSLMGDAAKRQTAGAAARRFVERHYSWEKTGQLMESLYQRAAGDDRN